MSAVTALYSVFQLVNKAVFVISVEKFFAKIHEVVKKKKVPKLSVYDLTRESSTIQEITPLSEYLCLSMLCYLSCVLI